VGLSSNHVTNDEKNDVNISVFASEIGLGFSPGIESMSQGLKPGWVPVVDVRTEVQTYLRSKDNSRPYYKFL